MWELQTFKNSLVLVHPYVYEMQLHETVITVCVIIA